MSEVEFTLEELNVDFSIDTSHYIDQAFQKDMEDNNWLVYWNYNEEEN